MKIIERIAKKFTKAASSTMKKEVKKTAIDLVPTVVSIAAAIAGALLFKGAVGGGHEEPMRGKPSVSNTNVTTNNYFFNDIGEETIKKLLEERLI